MTARCCEVSVLYIALTGFLHLTITDHWQCNEHCARNYEQRGRDFRAESFLNNYLVHSNTHPNKRLTDVNNLTATITEWTLDTIYYSAAVCWLVPRNRNNNSFIKPYLIIHTHKRFAKDRKLKTHGGVLGFLGSVPYISTYYILLLIHTV